MKSESRDVFNAAYKADLNLQVYIFKWIHGVFINYMKCQQEVKNQSKQCVFDNSLLTGLPMGLTAGATIPVHPLSQGPSYHKITIIIYGWPTA